jgi:CRISPR-associated endonuclease Cas1
MAASHNLPQTQIIRKSHVSRSGVLTLIGFGVKIRVQSGHLEIEDGIGPDRRKIKLARVGHGLRRLICISEDGFTTLGALKWLADVGASFVMLNRYGKVLLVTGPTAPSDARLRRAQALAVGNGVGLKISRTLIDAKLEGQQAMMRERFDDLATASEIAVLREKLSTAESANAIRIIEANAAVLYFRVVRQTPILWPKGDLSRIPNHWRSAGNRQSPLSGGPRLAITPVHAILNYCFALLESETRLALTASGLDPGLGLGLHNDTSNRDSLAMDVLEPVRPQIEAWVINWITREPLRRADFFETATGNCRLATRLCVKLSETAPTWGKLVAPWVEYVGRTLWAAASSSKSGSKFPTHLTQQHRRQAKAQAELPNIFAPRPQRTCRGCGTFLSTTQHKNCALCGVSISRNNMVEIAQRGRVAAKSIESRAKMSSSHKRQHQARRGFLHSSLPPWLTQESYRERVLPRLATITIPMLAHALSVSEPYAARVRHGRNIPHPRHWQTLAEIAGISANESDDHQV